MKFNRTVLAALVIGFVLPSATLLGSAEARADANEPTAHNPIVQIGDWQPREVRTLRVTYAERITPRYSYVELNSGVQSLVWNCSNRVWFDACVRKDGTLVLRVALTGAHQFAKIETRWNR